MPLLFTERLSDVPYVDLITTGRTTSDGSTIRPAESHWHMVFTKVHGTLQSLVVGPLSSSGRVHYGEGAEILWIRFKMGTYLSHLPTRNLLNSETLLPEAAGKSFWLKGSAWQFPDFENADTFVNRLIHSQILVHDPVVSAALEDELPDMSPRTVRHRFLHTTGLTQTQIRQLQRAQHAAALLREGKSILDTVYEAGYFDQPHLTRSLKLWIGHTPAQIVLMSNPKPCHSIQDSVLLPSYDTGVLADIG